GDRNAGYGLLEQLRARGDRTPFVIYAARATDEQKTEARQKGALRWTSRPEDLFESALPTLGRSRPVPLARDSRVRPVAAQRSSSSSRYTSITRTNARAVRCGAARVRRSSAGRAGSVPWPQSGPRSVR